MQNYHVCSLHFLPSDIKTISKRKTVIPGKSPSIFPDLKNSMKGKASEAAKKYEEESILGSKSGGTSQRVDVHDDIEVIQNASVN